MAYRPEATYDNRSAKPSEVSKPPATATVTALAACTQLSAASAADELIAHDRFLKPRWWKVLALWVVHMFLVISQTISSMLCVRGHSNSLTSCRILQVASSQEMQRRSQELGERCNLWKN